jgi:hypothetical protein
MAMMMTMTANRERARARARATDNLMIIAATSSYKSINVTVLFSCAAVEDGVSRVIFICLYAFFVSLLMKVTEREVAPTIVSASGSVSCAYLHRPCSCVRARGTILGKGRKEDKGLIDAKYDIKELELNNDGLDDNEQDGSARSHSCKSHLIFRA